MGPLVAAPSYPHGSWALKPTEHPGKGAGLGSGAVGTCLGDGQGKSSSSATGIFCSKVTLSVEKSERASRPPRPLPKQGTALHQRQRFSSPPLRPCCGAVALPVGMIPADLCQASRCSRAETANFCPVPKLNTARQDHFDYFFFTMYFQQIKGFILAKSCSESLQGALLFFLFSLSSLSLFVWYSMGSALI